MMHLVDLIYLIGIYNDFHLMAVITILCPSKSEGCKLLNIPTFSESHLVTKKSVQWTVSSGHSGHSGHSGQCPPPTLRQESLAPASPSPPLPTPWTLPMCQCTPCPPHPLVGNCTNIYLYHSCCWRQIHFSSFTPILTFQRRTSWAYWTPLM